MSQQSQLDTTRPSVRGLLLINLGTPAAPTPEALKRYLADFLMDEKVIDLPWLLRAALVRGIIIPRRAQASARAYQSIWTERGSPLLTHLLDLGEAVRSQLSSGNQTQDQARGSATRAARTPQIETVEVAMRYGEPSLYRALQRLREQQVTDLMIFPLYPQYAEATTASTLLEVRRVLGKIQSEAQAAASSAWHPRLHEVRSFYDHPAHTAAWINVIQQAWSSGRYEHLLMSFHGLPMRQLRKLDANCGSENCCAIAKPHCYKSQCFATARSLAEGLGLRDSQYTVAFQSRLGRAQWTRPYTSDVLRELPQTRNIRRLLVCTPAFVADGLESLEEIADRGREEFMHAGGEAYATAPCLNSHPKWIEGILQIADECFRRNESLVSKSVQAPPP
ncbi:MAG TPA: ferrochelatase [Pseudobdellovibrionaceae bacterium]|nr:ferrochelatase [Pseudobdellovibrionaceae bacterium]